MNLMFHFCLEPFFVTKSVIEMLHMLKMHYLIYKCFVFNFLKKNNLNLFK